MGVGYLGYPSHAPARGGMSTSGQGGKRFSLRGESGVSPSGAGSEWGVFRLPAARCFSCLRSGVSVNQ